MPMAKTAPINVDTLPLGQRQSVWQTQLSQLGIAAETGETVPSGNITLFTSRSGAVLANIVANAQRLRRHPTEGDPGILLILLRGGRAELTAPRRAIELAEGDLAIIDLAGEWQIGWRHAFDATLLAMPRAPLTARLGRKRVGLPAALGSTVAATAARSVLRALGTNLETMQQADLSAGEIATIELIASALLAELKAPEGEMTAVQSAHFRRVAAAIDRQLANPDLTPADIARQEGMSARYLQRLFERRGESFSDYVRGQRLERCRGDLIDPNHAGDSIAAIGLRWGFRDQAHFSRTFSATFGHTPSDVRRAVTEPKPSYGLRGRPATRTTVAASRAAPVAGLAADSPAAATQAAATGRYDLPATARTVHWGYLSRTLPPALRVEPGATITIETLTQHAGDDWDRMVTGDPGAESVFEWTASRKAVDRRGAGPMDASVFGRGAGEGFGVHICTGPIHVNGAEPGDVLEVEFLDIRPRPCANPRYAGKAFASNASAWWGYQYSDLLEPPQPRETITIFEIDLERPDAARALYSYRWTPQTDPFGTSHNTIDYPGVRVDHGSVDITEGILAGVEVPARMHFGFVGVAPREADIVDSIPPSCFGGNLDNWRMGKGSRIFLPVAVEGALLSMGDGHFAQADGEINGTGLECSLTGEIRVRLYKAGAPPPFLKGLMSPLIETPEAWVIQSFSYPNYLRELGRNAQTEVYQKSTVDLALRSAFRQARRFLMDVYGFSEDEALALMSLCVDFGVTQVADGNFGVHAAIRKSVLAGRRAQG
jgi:acetamidase/formamidase/AraC-like DNA-binding protein